MEESKKLFKSKNRIIAGVCGGIAEYFNVDPVIVRIVFVLLAVWAGVGLVLYIIGIIIIPEPGEDPLIRSKNAEELKERVQTVTSDMKKSFGTKRRKNGEIIIGLIILLIGFILLFNTFFPWISFGRLWPLLLIIIGVSILLSGTRKE